jgi:hypothetical protein
MTLVQSPSASEHRLVSRIPRIRTLRFPGLLRTRANQPPHPLEHLLVARVRVNRRCQRPTRLANRWAGGNHSGAGKWCRNAVAPSTFATYSHWRPTEWKVPAPCTRTPRAAPGRSLFWHARDRLVRHDRAAGRNRRSLCLHGVRQEDTAPTATLGDLRLGPDAGTGRAVQREHVVDAHADNLGEPQAGAERQDVDRVVALVAGSGLQDCSLLGLGEGRRAEVRHGNLLSQGCDNGGGSQGPLSAGDREANDGLARCHAMCA